MRCVRALLGGVGAVDVIVAVGVYRVGGQIVLQERLKTPGEKK